MSKFRTITFEVRVKPSTKEGYVIVIHDSTYLTEISHEVKLENLESHIEMLQSNFRGTVVGQVKENFKREADELEKERIAKRDDVEYGK